MNNRIFLALFFTLLTSPNLFGEDVEEASARISFGRRQLNQLLDDRPKMKGVLQENDPIFQWVVEGFNGKLFGKRVYWIANSPGSGSISEFSAPYMDFPPFVRLAAGSEATPIDLWAALVFELHNLLGFDEFDKLLIPAQATFLRITFGVY